MDVRGVGEENAQDDLQAQDPAPTPEALLKLAPGVKVDKRAVVLGWIALGISVAIAGLWAFWGTLEAFHEGWWKPTLGGRLLQTLAYHIAMLITMAMCLFSIRWPRLGAAVYFLLGGAFTFFIFKERWGNLTWDVVLSWVPLTVIFAGVGLLWWFGRPRPRRWAYLIAIAAPLLTSLICAAEPVWRVSHRDMTPQLAELTLPGNGVELTWAPPGPGWVRDAKHACDWHEATRICEHLSEDGSLVLSTTQGYWRLPTAAELVASVTRNGKNTGGMWDSEKKLPRYRVWPDKEPPLWDPIAETIYWWTSTENGPNEAFFMTFEGRLYSSMKEHRLGSMGFRAVRSVPGNGRESDPPDLAPLPSR